MVRLNILSLKCPECAVDLDGLEHDEVFFCRNCKMGFEAGEGGFKGQTYGSIKPRKKDFESLIWLPMWMFHVSLEIEAKPKELERAQSIMKDYTRVWVSAFRMFRASYFGDPGYLYTSNALDLDGYENPNPPRLAGLSRPYKQALEFIEPYLLSILDRRIDVAFIEINCDIIQTRLLAVPFGIRGDKIIDTQIDWEYPAMFVEDLHLIRRLKAEGSRLKAEG